MPRQLILQRPSRKSGAVRRCPLHLRAAHADSRLRLSSWLRRRLRLCRIRAGPSSAAIGAARHMRLVPRQADALLGVSQREHLRRGGGAWLWLRLPGRSFSLQLFSASTTEATAVTAAITAIASAVVTISIAIAAATAVPTAIAAALAAWRVRLVQRHTKALLGLSLQSALGAG